MTRTPPPFLRPLVTAGLTLVMAGSMAAQSLTNGSLRGQVLAKESGAPLTGVQVTVEGTDGRAVAYLETDASGQFTIPLLVPGAYRVLAEDVGLQPVRYVGVAVLAGQTTALTLRLERRPPPITTVDELVYPGATTGSALGRTVLGRWLRNGDRHRAGTDASRGLTEVVAPADGREGWALAAGGRVGGARTIMVDGVPEPLLRHPGLPGEPASAPLFQRDGLTMLQALGVGLDAEWRESSGVLPVAQTARGGSTMRFRPYGTFATGAVAGPDDNPADSATYSMQAGAEISGPIVPDTASFLLRVDYQNLRTASAHTIADPGLREQLGAVGDNTYGVDMRAALSPVVREWSGFSGFGRLDWRLSRHHVMFRFGYATWMEENPLLLEERSNLAGTSLEANDASGALSVTSTWASVANELRIGVASTKRDWQGGDLPATAFAAEGVAIGSSTALPGLFSQQVMDVSNAVQLSAGRHRIKGGIQLSATRYEQDYIFGSAGRYFFGGVDAFDRGVGTFVRTVGPAQGTANPRIGRLGLFLQDTWTATPEVSLLLGLRYDRETLPTDQIAVNQAWFNLTAERNDSVVNAGLLSPRIALAWDVQNRGEWVVQGGAGLFPGRVDPAIYAEASLHDLGTKVYRAQGTLSAWPRLPSTGELEDMGERLTYFNGSYRTPRAFKAGLGISRNFGDGLALHLAGQYQHTDYLLRRTDRNLSAAPVGTTQEGREVWGRLVQQDGLISPAPGTNRRFRGFDQVHILSPTGYSDYAEFSALLERSVERGLSLSAAYTFSRTQDNVPGARSVDPADQLNPFPNGLDGADWTDGRSDFDVPHRAAISADYSTGGRTPIGLGARFRYRSGLPFTPGFHPGVDVNGDGAGQNDPAFLDAGVATVADLLAGAGCPGITNAFAARNSCREDAAYGLDLRLSVGLPISGGPMQRLALTLDAFNVVTSPVGIVDRALVLVDPAGTILTNSAGRVTLPLVANPNFGSLLIRRNDLRTVRVGLRMEY